VQRAAARPWADVNRGHLIYEHEATTELLEVVHASYRRLLEIASRRIADPSRVHEANESLNSLETRVMNPSHWGEISEFITRGLAILQVPQLRERILSTLTVRRGVALYQEQRRTRRFDALLTILFGFLAVPALATEVVRPLFDYLCLPRPTDSSASQLLFVSVASAVLLLTLALARLAAGRQRPDRLR
jgi:hypothetical protein